jgi:hypothetical protein
MMAMMVLSYGGFAAFAEVEGDQSSEQPAVTEETTAPEEVVEEEPATPAEGEEVQNEDVQDEEAGEAGEAVEAEEEEEVVEVVEEAEGEEALLGAIGEIQITANHFATYDCTWEAFEGADSYKIYIDGSLAEEGITDTKYNISGLTAGTHSVKIEAWAADGDAPLASGSTSFVWEDSVPCVGGINALAGYNSVSVEWKAVDGITEYSIYRKNVKTGAFSLLKNVNVSALKQTANSDGSTLLTYRDTTANGKNVTYWYKVYPVKNGELANDYSYCSNGEGKVRSISYFVTTKTKKTLTSHDGKNKKLYLPKGKRIECSGFGGGKYTFYYMIGGKEYYFYINAISVKGATASYAKGMNYSRKEAENYINERGIASSTKYLVWASLYTQHTYVFYGSKGKWKVVRDFECASGAANKPSPSGSWKEIHRKIKTRHARPYWSCYSDINAFHSVKNAGKKNEQGVGYPASNGCIRLKKPNAYYIYNYCPKKTRVVVC